ncbi:MAG: RHS repeat-associated core domain-containing protein, partial [Chthonomonadaceae bacterium]|nr:RHS repeat-associated core domain-containing protein [Chthonomonadaceae bacterium]
MIDNRSGNLSALTTAGVSGVMSRHISSYAYSWYHCFDPQGNFVTFVRSNSSSGGQYDLYDAYGLRASNSPPNLSDPFMGFGGQAGYVSDGETGLILCGQRYYDPLQGRWITQDPIGRAGGDNLYAYCDGNPVMNFDPSGLQINKQIHIAAAGT